MTDLQLQLQLTKYTIKSSFSEPPSPEEPSLSPHTFQPLPRIYPSAHWYTNPHIMKTSAQEPTHPPIMAPPPLTTAALLTLLLAGFTFMALFAYSSPLPSPATLHDDPTINLGDNPLASVISKSASVHHTQSTSPPGLLTMHTDPGMISTQNRENLSNSTHSNIDSQGSQRGPSGSNVENSAPGDWDAAFAREIQEAQRGGGRTAPANSEVHGGGVH